MGRLAVAEAGARLPASGAGVGERRRLGALRRAAEQMVAAPEHGRDERPYRAYLDELYARLDGEPPSAGMPELPLQRHAPRWWALGGHRDDTGVSRGPIG